MAGAAGAAALRSMTGYARTTGQAGAAVWVWEIRGINAKGLDLRLRVPPGLDALETAARARTAAAVKRGTVQAALAIQRPRPRPSVRIDRAKLDALLASVAAVALPPGIAPATLDGLLSLPGMVEVEERADEGDAGSIERALLAGLDEALAAFDAARGDEGAALGRILADRLSGIGRLVAEAEAAPGRTPEAFRARLARRVEEIEGAAPGLDPARLYGEALLMAAKADVREEIDRLGIHVAAASALLAEGGAVGRRLDFLAQELAREAGTLCAKSGDAALTATGLALRTEIEQFREQVQNLE